MGLADELQKTWKAYCEAQKPQVERKPRLTIHTTGQDVDPCWTSWVTLDGLRLHGFEMFIYRSEPEARAAAQAYVDELVKHFRGGGE